MASTWQQTLNKVNSTPSSAQPTGYTASGGFTYGGTTPTSYTNLMTPNPTGSNYVLQSNGGNVKSVGGNSNSANALGAFGNNGYISFTANPIYGSTGSSSQNNYAPAVQYTPVTHTVNVSNLSNGTTRNLVGSANSTGVGSSGTTAVIMPSAPAPASGSTGSIAQNNINAGLNADGTTRVTSTTGTSVGKDIGFGTNPDGTPKTATQATQEAIQNEFNQLKRPADIAEQYNKAQAQSGQIQAQNQVNSLQNQVNAVNTRLQTDLQSLRGIGAKEGVTEAVYGQISAEVIREGNLQLLPLQAQLSAAQGNLDVAKQQTDTLFKIYAQDAQNSVDFYNKQVEALANAKISGITAKEQQRLDDLKTQKSNDFTLLNNQIQSFNSAANAALNRGDIQTYNAITSGVKNINTNVNSPTFAEDNARVMSSIGNTVVQAVASQVSQDIASTTDANSGSILSQTGLSVPAFSYLTKGTAALTRLSSADRQKFMNEAASWANKNGIDISTFSSQYDAYNTALQNNIKRFNNTKIMENEVLGTVQNLSTVADEKSFGALKIANVAKLFAGEQVNDPATLQYATHLNQLRAEMAGYNAATQGKNSADVVDYQEAERLINNGLSSGSLQGFTKAIESSTMKMGQVLQNSVDNTRKQVWDLFGVGSNYQPEAARAVAVGGTVTVNGQEYKKNSDGTFDLVSPSMSNSTEEFSAGLANWFK